jgi:hypothetical protein
MAVPRLQFAQGRVTQIFFVLVRKGRRAQVLARTATFLLWADMVGFFASPGVQPLRSVVHIADLIKCSTTDIAKEVSSPVSYHLPCRPLSTMRPDGPNPILLLQQEVAHTALH